MMPEEQEDSRLGLTESSASRDAWFPVGKVAKPHGIKGEIKVQPYSGDPATLPGFPTVRLMDSEHRPVGTYRLTGGRMQGRLAILRLAGIESREQAEAVAGCEVWVEKVHLPPLTDQEFYWREMKGRRVVTTDGLELGEVTDLLATGAHDILVVSGRGREYLIPATREFMVESGEESGTIVIQPVPGLLEIND
jgi:16S rRNA processing protein RimM